VGSSIDVGHRGNIDPSSATASNGGLTIDRDCF